MVVVGAGVLRAVAGNRSDDLILVHSWLVYWLHLTANPYTGATAVNYPPHAFIVLGPLALMSKDVVVLVWACVNAVLAPLVSWALVRDWPLEKHDRVIVTALVTSWNAVLTGIWMGQFTTLAILFGVAGLRTVQSPWRSGALLAASAIKPHIGVIFLLWVLVRGHYRVLVTAALWCLVGLLAMAAWARTSPVVVVQTWLDVLSWMFGGNSLQRGVTEWWGLIEAFLPSRMAGTLRVAGAIAGIVLLGAAVRRTMFRDPTGRVALGLIALWSLATLFHRRYDLILLAPAFACLWGAARGASDGRRWWVGLALLHVALLVDVPWAWQLYYGPHARPNGPLAWLAVNFDRLTILAVACAMWIQVTKNGQRRVAT